MSRTRLLLLPALLPVLLLGALVLPAVPAAHAQRPIEPYASYEPANRCTPKAKPGTKQLGRYLVRRYGGGFGPISRHCKRRRDVTSEHQEGRAFDWTLDARTAAGRRTARTFLGDLSAADGSGNADALARRMGVMYVIWNDHVYAAWDGFRPEPYLSSSCRTRKRCSQTLRHRDHVHVTLTRRAARAQTSWYRSR